jgi:hypothetical protein
LLKTKHVSSLGVAGLNLKLNQIFVCVPAAPAMLLLLCTGWLHQPAANGGQLCSSARPATAVMAAAMGLVGGC